MKLILLMAALSAADPGLAWASTEIVRSQLFPVDQPSGKPAFTQETTWTDEPGGTRHETASLKDDSGTVVMREESVLRGWEVLSQSMEQLQTKRKYELKREGKELVFLTYDLESPAEKPDEKREEIPADFITGPAVGAFLKTHWEDLRGGKTVAANFGVFEVQRSVGFEFSWQGMKDGTVSIRMKPSSTLISMVVGPIFLYLLPDGSRILRLVGRTPLKRRIMGNLKSFDAEIHYDAPEVLPAAALKKGAASK